jgi:hypothetical protein
MDPSTLNARTVQLLDRSNNPVPATVTYNAATKTVSLQPTAPLAQGTAYNFVLLGGTSGAVVKDSSGIALASTFTLPISTVPNPNDFINTPYMKIPNFGAHPTVISTQSGAWSSPSTWSTSIVPTTGDIVDIEPGTTVTYDVNSTAAVNTVEILSGGTLSFRTDVNTGLTVVNFLVLQGGTLQIGTPTNPVAPTVTAQVIFANQPLNLAFDPEQYGNGLIGMGTVTVCGAPRPLTFVSLATEPKAGDTSLTLASAVTGWSPGDQLVLPDSRQYRTAPDESERVTIASVSADGTVVTLTAPLQYAHPGGRDANGVLDFLPYAGELTNNVKIRSQSATGTRGYVMFTQRASVDIRYATFGGLGRTKIDALDPTTFDASGNLINIGSNEDERSAVEFLHYLGPTTTPANGYQFTMIGDAVYCPLDPMPFRWGIVLDDANYGLLQDNVLFNWSGAGIMSVSGSESYNTVQHNFIADIETAAGIDRPDDRNIGNFVDIGIEGSAFWFRSPNNNIVNNVAADTGRYGYQFYTRYAPNNGMVKVPLFPGADSSVSGQFQTVQVSSMPILNFSGNQSFAGYGGLSYWWLGAIDQTADDTGTSVFKDFTAWSIRTIGVWGYESSDVVLDHFVLRDDPALVTTETTGIGFADYFTNNGVIKNADIQGFKNGIVPSTNTRGSTFTIQDSYLRNYFNIVVGPRWFATGDLNQVGSRTVVISNVRFDSLNLPSNPIGPQYNIVRTLASDGDRVNWIALDQIIVYNYNGVTGDNFKVYYAEQLPSSVLVQSSYLSDGELHQLGSPVAGLTNQQNWDLYGIALAGELAPATATTRQGIDGLVNPI